MSYLFKLSGLQSESKHFSSCNHLCKSSKLFAGLEVGPGKEFLFLYRRVSVTSFLWRFPQKMHSKKHSKESRRKCILFCS